MKKFLQRNKWLIISILCIFLFTLIFPFSGDDHQWKLEKISVNMISKFAQDASLNGRYMGNILVTIMTKSIFIRGFLMSIVIATIHKLIEKETNASKTIIYTMMLLMPLSIFKQTIIWTSGFTNYVISTLFLIVSLLMIKNSFNNKEKYYHWFINMVVLFISSLFIENQTIFLLIFLIPINIIYIIKNKKLNISLSFAFLGSIIGTIVMFMQPAYWNVINGVDGYRSYANNIVGFISKSINNYVNVIQKYIAFENIAIIILITILLFVYYKKHKKDYSKKENKILKVILGFMYIYSVYIIISRLNPNWNIFLKYTKYFNALLSTIYIILLLIITFKLFHKKKSFLELLMPLIVITGLVAPLFIVNPIGPRNFYAVYILEIIFALKLLKETEIDISKYNKYLFVIIILFLGLYTSIYSYISIINFRRDNYIVYKSNNSTDTSVTVPRIPYAEYVWGGDFEGDYRENIYKESLGLREDMSFNFVSYDEWLKQIQKEGYKVK